MKNLFASFWNKIVLSGAKKAKSPIPMYTIRRLCLCSFDLIWSNTRYEILRPKRNFAGTKMNRFAHNLIFFFRFLNDCFSGAHAINDDRSDTRVTVRTRSRDAQTQNTAYRQWRETKWLIREAIVPEIFVRFGSGRKENELTFSFSFQMFTITYNLDCV